MGKKLFISILLLLLCACAQSNNNKECLSNQYVDILRSGNYYMSYMDSSMAYDHTPVFVERAQKGILSAVRYEMQGNILSSISDNETITLICNGEILMALWNIILRLLNSTLRIKRLQSILSILMITCKEL